MGQTDGYHRNIFSMRSTAAMPLRRERTGMGKYILGFLVAVMTVAVLALGSAAGAGLAQAQTNNPSTFFDHDVLNS